MQKKYNIQLYCGDVIEVLAEKPDESYVACFCDPPYGLKFMGKDWDHGVPGVPYWAEILRVLKPGAILLSFGGTRTWHRLGVAIEDAGFELFDTLMWLHGQGFPKSASIGKMLDKAAGAKREIIGKHPNPLTKSDTGRYQWNVGGEGKTETNITAPATDAAKTWEGYGTSLKPAWEPILMARKPRRGTYAQTAMEHSSGALNIDECRVGTEKITINTWDDGMKPFGDGAGHPFTGRQQSGRWPANLLLSHLSECDDECCAEDCPVAMLDRQSGVLTSGAVKGGGKYQLGRFEGQKGARGLKVQMPSRASTGHASRFFKIFDRFYYCAKSSRREREAGLQGHLPCLTCGEIDTTHHTNKADRKITCRRCDHPTVKPIALCEYIARLIRPPEAYLGEAQLLVPFCGVGSEIIGSLKAGWRNITGIDIVQEYIDIANLRIAKIQQEE